MGPWAKNVHLDAGAERFPHLHANDPFCTPFLEEQCFSLLKSTEMVRPLIKQPRGSLLHESHSE